MIQKRITKSSEINRLKAEVVELRELNLNLAKTLKMVEDGQWVVISETDLKRYQNGIKRLLEAGDGLNDYLGRNLDGTTNGQLPCRDAWDAAKASDNFGA